MSERAGKPNSFDVMKEMGRRNGKLYLAPVSNILRFQKVQAGVQVTIGVDGSLLHGLMNDEFCGGLILADKQEFDAVSQELREAEEARTQS